MPEPSQSLDDVRRTWWPPRPLWYDPNAQTVFRPRLDAVPPFRFWRMSFKVWWKP